MPILVALLESRQQRAAAVNESIRRLMTLAAAAEIRPTTFAGLRGKFHTPQRLCGISFNGVADRSTTAEGMIGGRRVS